MNALVPFDHGGMPAVFAGRQSASLAAAQAGVTGSFAIVGYKGRNWHIKFRSEDTLVTSDGKTPMPNLDVVIVGVSPYIAKQFYEKRYTEGSDEAPDCFSLDGITPDVSAQKKQHATCATCPNNAWGSRMTDDGKKGKACQDSRRIAVVPLYDLENEAYGGPMMVRVPPMSLSNLANYGALLQRKGAGGMEFVATRLGFDYDVAYPRITFEPLGWLSNEQAIVIVGEDGASGICSNPIIERMLSELMEAPAVPATQEPASALDQGGPAAVMTAALEATVAAVEQAFVAAPVAAPAAPVVAAPVAPVATASAPAAPAKRQRSGGGFTAPATAPAPAPAVTAAPVMVAAAPVLVPAAPAPADVTMQVAPPPVTQMPTTVAGVPEDMQSAIDALLA